MNVFIQKHPGQLFKLKRENGVFWAYSINRKHSIGIKGKDVLLLVEVVEEVPNKYEMGFILLVKEDFVWLSPGMFDFYFEPITTQEEK